jgi:hypothetical protein
MVGPLSKGKKMSDILNSLFKRQQTIKKLSFCCNAETIFCYPPDKAADQTDHLIECCAKCRAKVTEYAVATNVREDLIAQFAIHIVAAAVANPRSMYFCTSPEETVARLLDYLTPIIKLMDKVLCEEKKST